MLLITKQLPNFAIKCKMVLLHVYSPTVNLLLWDLSLNLQFHASNVLGKPAPIEKVDLINLDPLGTTDMVLLTII